MLHRRCRQANKLSEKLIIDSCVFIWYIASESKVCRLVTYICKIYLSISELSEDWSSVREPVIEGVPFYVKYLGSSLVQKASGEEATADAIKTIVTMVSE